MKVLILFLIYFELFIHRHVEGFLTERQLRPFLCHFLKPEERGVKKWYVNLLSANPTKWSNTLKEFVG